MKTSAPVSIGPNVQAADLYIVTLVDGTVIEFTNCDRRLTSVPVPTTVSTPAGYSGTFSVLRSKRKQIVWETGVKPSALSLDITVGPTDLADLGLDWRVAAQRGVLDWAQIKVWRAFGNTTGAGPGLFTVNDDGSATPFLTIPIWVGYIASASVDRGKVSLECYDPRVLMNMMLPRYTFGALCRWTLYNPGDGAHGCPVNRNQYAFPTTVAAGSTRQVVNIPAIATPSGSAAGPWSPGWFEQGYVLGTNGNANQRSTIRKYVPAIQNWITTALGDGPVAFYPCGDAPGSPILLDVGPNHYNGTVHGAVQFGQTNLGPIPFDGVAGLPAGMPPPYTTAAFFNNWPNGNAYVTLPIPAPWQLPGYGGGFTFEFVAFFRQPSIANVLPGVFDTAPGQNYALRCWSGPGNGQGTGGHDFDIVAEWAQEMPIAPTQVAGFGAHYTLVFRGDQTAEIYLNGNLANSVTTGGSGIIAWGTTTNYGSSDGPMTIGRVRPNDDLSLAPNIQGGYQYFYGGMMGFGIYAFPFSPAQVRAHANAALNAYSTATVATLYLVDPLPNIPQTGDPITLYPGCNLTYPTCVKKFNVGQFFGGFPTIPDAEQAI